MNIRVEPYHKKQSFAPFTIQCPAQETVENLLCYISLKDNDVDITKSELYFNGKKLKKSETLFSYNLLDQSVVQLEKKPNSGQCCYIF